MRENLLVSFHFLFYLILLYEESKVAKWLQYFSLLPPLPKSANIKILVCNKRILRTMTMWVSATN